MLPALSALVALACVLASARRLWIAVAPTSLDPLLLRDEGVNRAFGPPLRSGDWARIRDGLSKSGATWEGDLFGAFEASDEGAREGLIEEQLLELAWLSSRWSRVPRVCASIATSAGFLFGCLAVLRGFAAAEPEAGGAGGLTALTDAVDSLTLGVAGASFCVAVHLRAPRIVRERLASMDRLVERLRALAAERA
jgi:hypothetical protein